MLKEDFANLGLFSKALNDVSSENSDYIENGRKNDRHGSFLFSVTFGLSPEEKEEEEKKHQERLVELMAMHQRYHGIIQDEEYVPRGSKLTCSWGGKPALLNTLTDHGVYKGTAPIMTCMDCRKWNLHDFDSCMCPESRYEGRIEMTVAVHQNGRVAQKAPWNQYPHICVPLINEEEGWHQAINRVWIENEYGERERVLVRTAFLVCRYGGIIHVDEVSEGKSIEEIVEEAYQILKKWFLEGYKSVPQDQLDMAMEDMAMYGEINKISCLQNPNISDSEKDKIKVDMLKRIQSCMVRQDKYDGMILAWVNYWNMTMKIKRGQGGAQVRPDIIKSMVLVESNLGEGNIESRINQNPERDIMQSLDPRNPVLWIVIGEASKGTITVERAESDVLELGIDKEITFNNISTDAPGQGQVSFFEGGNSKAVKEIISPDLGRYYAGKVTPELSIAIGVGCYCMNLNGATDGTSPRSEKTAVERYNGGGDADYARKVNIVLENMGAKQLGE